MYHYFFLFFLKNNNKVACLYSSFCSFHSFSNNSLSFDEYFNGKE